VDGHDRVLDGRRLRRAWPARPRLACPACSRRRIWLGLAGCAVTGFGLAGAAWGALGCARLRFRWSRARWRGPAWLVAGSAGRGQRVWWWHKGWWPGGGRRPVGVGVAGRCLHWGGVSAGFRRWFWLRAGGLRDHSAWLLPALVLCCCDRCGVPGGFSGAGGGVAGAGFGWAGLLAAGGLARVILGWCPSRWAGRRRVIAVAGRRLIRLVPAVRLVRLRRP
jgi:hypothetical protein